MILFVVDVDLEVVEGEYVLIDGEEDDEQQLFETKSLVASPLCSGTQKAAANKSKKRRRKDISDVEGKKPQNTRFMLLRTLHVSDKKLMDFLEEDMTRRDAVFKSIDSKLSNVITAVKSCSDSLSSIAESLSIIATHLSKNNNNL